MRLKLVAPVVAIVAVITGSALVPAAPASADPDYRCVDQAMYDAVPIGMSLGDLFKHIDAIGYSELWLNEGGWVHATYLGCEVDSVARFKLRHTAGIPGWQLVEKDWVTGTAITRPGQLELRDAALVGAGCWLRLLPVNPSAGPTRGPYAGTSGWRQVPFDISCSDPFAAVRGSARITTLDGAGARDSIYRFKRTEPFVVTEDASGTTTYESQSALNPCLLRSDGRMHKPGEGRPWLLPIGSHTLLFGALAGVNRTPGDGHPFTTVVEQRAFVTCTTERRSYR